MAISPDSSRPQRPSDRVIAFAICVVRSKPDGISVREYIHHLRQHIAKGRRVDALSFTHRHLDRSSYWRSRYERLEAELEASKGQVLDLKKGAEELKAQLESRKTSAPAKKSLKRKKVDEDVVPVPRFPKRARREQSPSSRHAIDERLDDDFDHLGEIGNILMRSLYQIGTVLRKRQRTDLSLLAHHLIKAASALPQIIHQILERNFTDPRYDAQKLHESMNAAERSILVLLNGFNKLSHLAQSSEVQGQIIYAYVKMYQNMIQMLGKTSSAAASEQTARTIQLATSNAKAKQSKQPDTKDDSALDYLTKLLCKMITHLDAKAEAHRALFEGFTFLALERLGATLYTLVFGHVRAQSMEEEIAISARPDEIEDADEPGPTSPEGSSLQAAKLEAPYLVHLLNHIMHAAPVHLGSVMSATTSKPKQANRDGSMKGALVRSAKDRLQRTLMNCVFGIEGLDADDPMMDCLKLPVRQGPALPVPKVKAADVQDWFKEELWRLLGWEILSKEEGV